MTVYQGYMMCSLQIAIESKREKGGSSSQHIEYIYSNTILLNDFQL